MGCLVTIFLAPVSNTQRCRGGGKRQERPSGRFVASEDLTCALDASATIDFVVVPLRGLFHPRGAQLRSNALEEGK